MSLSDIISSAFRKAFRKPVVKKPVRKRHKPKPVEAETPVEVETPIEAETPVEVEVLPKKSNEKLLRQIVRRRRKSTHHPPCQVPIPKPKPKLLLEFRSPVSSVEIELVVDAMNECPGRWLTADGVFERIHDPDRWYGSAQTYVLAVARVTQILACAIAGRQLEARQAENKRVEYHVPGTVVPKEDRAALLKAAKADRRLRPPD